MGIASWFHKELSIYFSITINLKISSFLGMQIDHDETKNIVTISQPVYVTNKICRYCQSLFMQIVGSLLFLLTRSRPDISFHVNYLSLFMKSATNHQLKLAKRILVYIFHAKDLTLTFNSNAALQIHAFVDSSYASHLDRKSQFGVSIHINDSSGSCISISKERNYCLSLLLKRNIWPCLKHPRRSFCYVDLCRNLISLHQLQQ